MRVAIDATSIPPRPAGAGTYAIQLAQALMQRDPRDGYAVFTRGPWFEEAARARKNWRVERISHGSRVRRLVWEQARLPGELQRLGIDLLHSTHHTLPLRPMSARRVVTVHDLTFFRLPQRYPFARRLYMQAFTRLSARVADAIIVPSRTVRDEVRRMLPAAASKVRVIYEAAAPSYRPIPPEDAHSTAASYGLDAPYILSVGSMEPGKNRARLYRAVGQLRDEGVECTLAVVGQKAWGYERELGLIDELHLRDHVRILGYVKDEDLPALQSAATALAFPSLYEGFGLPVLEAMACGTPVLTSNVSATAEVAADAALLVDPHSVPSIAEALRRLICDNDLRIDLRERGRRRAAEFSWTRAADETYGVYRSVLEATS